VRDVLREKGTPYAELGLSDPSLTERARHRRAEPAGFGGVTPAALFRRIAAEALGTGLLVATVVGSGIMAEKLAGGNVAIALLGNTRRELSWSS